MRYAQFRFLVLQPRPRRQVPSRRAFELRRKTYFSVHDFSERATCKERKDLPAPSIVLPLKKDAVIAALQQCNFIIDSSYMLIPAVGECLHLRRPFNDSCCRLEGAIDASCDRFSYGDFKLDDRGKIPCSRYLNSNFVTVRIL